MSSPTQPVRPQEGSAGAPIEVTVLAFARAREALGQSRLTLTVPADSTVDECLDEVARRHTGIAAMREGLLLAVNEAYAHGHTRLRAGDTVGLIPPVSGG